MSEPVIPKPTLNFLSEWLFSTTQILFDPRSFSVVGEGTRSNPNQASRNLAFAASSIAVAFVIFQLDSNHWSPAKGTKWALLLIGVWCLYAVISAFLLKLMKGTQDHLTNILFGIRLFAIFLYHRNDHRHRCLPCLRQKISCVLHNIHLCRNSTVCDIFSDGVLQGQQSWTNAGNPVHHLQPPIGRRAIVPRRENRDGKRGPDGGTAIDGTACDAMIAQRQRLQICFTAP